MSQFTFRNLRFHRGDFALHADLTLPEGKLTVILGPSGCGKTTLLHLAAGFLRPAAGGIFEGAREVTHLKSEKRRVGVVFQDHALFPHMSVEKNVSFGPRMRGANRREAREIAREKLRLVELTSLAHRRPASLSGGERQRVALARALAIAPDIVLLDEPFSSLDAALRVSLRRQVKSILGDAGVTAVLVTHDQEEALAMADYLAVMNAGRIVAFGTPPEIRRRPPDPFTASFLGRTGRLRVLGLAPAPGRPGDLLARTRAGTIRLPAAANTAAAPPRTADTASAGDAPANMDHPPSRSPAALMIRPEALTLTKNPANPANPPEGESVITGRIVLREYRGRDWALQLVPAGEHPPPPDRIPDAGGGGTSIPTPRALSPDPAIPHDAPPPLPDRIEADWSDGEPPPAGTVLSFRVSGEEVHPV